MEKTWIDLRKEIGDKCEDIIEDYIQDKVPYSTYEKTTLYEAYKGYDFKVTYNDTVTYIEVKHLGHGNTIHITLNELHKALKYEKKYYLYIVDIDKDILYIVQDPIHTLDMPIKFLSDTLYTNDYTIFIANSYKVFLKRLDTVSDKIYGVLDSGSIIINNTI